MLITDFIVGVVQGLAVAVVIGLLSGGVAFILWGLAP